MIPIGWCFHQPKISWPVKTTTNSALSLAVGEAIHKANAQHQQRRRRQIQNP
jgi:hypothetical protein